MTVLNLFRLSKISSRQLQKGNQNRGLDGNDAYINAGVLLINVNRLRKLDVKGLIDAYMKKYEKLINYADQDILNGVFKKEIGVLSPVYDLMTIVSVYSYDEIKVLRSPTNYYIVSKK